MSDLKKDAQTMETSLFLQNLVKLIPVEIIALFAIIKGLIPVTASPTSIMVVFGALVVLVPFYVIFAMRVKSWTQVVLMTVAFPIWIIAIGGMPIPFNWFEPWMISVSLALFTLIPPMFYGSRIKPDELNTKSSTKLKKKIPLPIRSWREVE